jgi:hypothetical protein
MNLESILKQKNIKLSDKIKNNKNGIECNLDFISKAYNTKKPIEFINNHNFSNIFMHPKQLMNLFNNIIINKDEIIYDNITYKICDFIKKINKYTIYNVIDLTIKCEINLLKQTKLLLLVYIGNEEIGNILIEKIKKYKSKQDFAVVFIINKNINIDIKPLEFFENYAVYKTNEFGNDIVPTLLVYRNIVILNFDYEYIIKLHTKSNSYFERATNYLLNEPLEELLLRKISRCNTISHSYYNIKADKFNLNLYKKYKNLIRNENFSVGTIFLINKDIFFKVLLFLVDNYKYCVFNNMYDDNSVNRHNSYVHFIERLFGLL